MYDYRITVTQHGQIVLDTATAVSEWAQVCSRKDLVSVVCELLSALGEEKARERALTLIQGAMVRRSYGLAEPALYTIGAHDVGLVIAPAATRRQGAIRSGVQLWLTTLLGADAQRRLIADDTEGYPYSARKLDEVLLAGARWATDKTCVATAQQGLRCEFTGELSADVLTRKTSVLRVQMSRRKARGIPGRGYSDIPFSVEVRGGDGVPWTDRYLLHVEVLTCAAKEYADLPPSKEDL